jgi:hypothetical protein
VMEGDLDEIIHALKIQQQQVEAGKV